MGVGALASLNIRDEVKAAKADDGTLTTVYYAVDKSVVGEYTVKLNVKLQGDADNWAQYVMNRDGYLTQDGKDLYTCTYTDLSSGVACMQFQLYNGSEWVSQQEPISSWTSVSVYNGKVYVHNTGWAEYNPDDTYTLSRYKVLTGYGEDKKPEGPYLIDQLVVPAGYEYDCTKGVYVYGRVWTSWYIDPNLSEYAPNTITIDADISIYGKYDESFCYPSVYNVDLGNSGWTDGEADYAIMFFNDFRYSPAAQEWSEYVENVPAGQRLVKIQFQNHFDDLVIVRYNKDNTKELWENDRWANVWNQTVDSEIDTELICRIGEENEEHKNAVINGCPAIYEWYQEPAQEAEWRVIDGLNGAKLNASNHPEYFNDIEFNSYMSFRIGVAPYNTEYDLYNDFELDPSIEEGSFIIGEDGNIHNTVLGTFSFYFDSYTHHLYITKAGMAEAEYFAQNYLLELIVCDASGESLPLYWDSAVEYYDDYVSDAARDILYAAVADEHGSIIEQGVAKYDAAVRNHPQLTRFIVNSGGAARPVSASRYAVPYTFDIANDNMMLIVILTSISSFGLIVVLMIYKRRKQK